MKGFPDLLHSLLYAGTGGSELLESDPRDRYLSSATVLAASRSNIQCLIELSDFGFEPNLARTLTGCTAMTFASEVCISFVPSRYA